MNRMYGSGAPLSIWHDFMVNALASTPRTGFSNPVVALPPEPENKQDDKDKDKDKDPEKEKDKDKQAPATVTTEGNANQAPVVSNQPTKKKRSIKERVNEIMGKPAGSNQPTPRI